MNPMDPLTNHILLAQVFLSSNGRKARPVIRPNMDALKSLIAQRKEERDKIKEKVKPSATSKSGKKYVRRGDIERAMEMEQTESATAATAAATAQASKSEPSTVSKAKKPIESIELDMDKIINGLRELSQPITLFGETDLERYNRFQVSLESDHRELGVGEGHAIRNQFLEKETEDAHTAAIEHEEEEDDDDQLLNGNLSDSQLVYRFFRKLLRSWARDLVKRREHVKKTPQGKMATKTMKQCKDYIKPLFKLCRKDRVPDTILVKLVEIVRCCQAGEFVRANDAYIGVAIGNAAWPIGVTSVGIHERCARERINSNKQAHVMNNELQRKYLTSVKRLISYCQSTSNVLPSQKVS